MGLLLFTHLGELPSRLGRFDGAPAQRAPALAKPLPLPGLQARWLWTARGAGQPPMAGSGAGAGGGAGARLARETTRAGASASRGTVLYLGALVVAMVGATYGSVPLYRMFCQATGFGGTVQRRETVEEKIAKHEDSTAAEAARQRELTIRFNADVSDGMPWRFYPCQREVVVKPGQSTLAFYTAQNLSKSPITGVSTYNVSPMQAGIYFNKVQCFCFEEQKLRAGEKIDMPVFFYIDPEFAVDPKMANIKSLTLSYTFFKVEDDS